MQWFILAITTLLFVLNSEQKRSSLEDDTYVAAVVEYRVQGNADTNLQNYIELIIDAADQDADIVVFPEMTLTRGASVLVPIHGDLKEFPVPADYPNIYDQVLVQISEVARQRQIYVVINVQEQMSCPSPGEFCPEDAEDQVFRFNTNVVFDRNGAVVDRYRKINLFGEFTRTPAFQPELGVFTTDFGVTFGHYICFDLLFQVPAIQVLQKHNITDIVFTTMWFSELPYLTAVQIQEAYAYAKNVNFLAAGANNVNVGSAGSGIYSGKAGALISLMPGVPTTRLLVATVPKVPGQVTGSHPGPQYPPAEELDGLHLLTDPSLPAHVSRLLVPGSQEFTLVDKEVSCKFRVKLNYHNSNSVYTYRASAFDGVRTYSGHASGGVRICSVFACTNTSIESCGRRFDEYDSNSTAIFEELSITTTVPKVNFDTTVEADDSAYFPVSMEMSILPLKPEDFQYTMEESNGQAVYDVSLRKFDTELLSFGLWGRVYGRDGEDPTEPEKSTPEDDTYVAAVVEYSVQGNTEANLQNYIELIIAAADQNADIVVFPEMTLTRGTSVPVPMHGFLKEFPVPADYPHIYNPVLVQISEVARQRQIYVVINVQEQMSCPSPGEFCPEDGEDKVFRFNTNVVFDRNGAVIDRYRKINLFGEFTRTPAFQPELGVFTTDFGVTFGHYICFDLMFQIPAVQVLQKHNITDIIFTTMWFSELPYLTAVQIQEAYAYAKNVNFLAAGANNVNVGSAGSGIYSGKAGALISLMPGVPTTRLLVATVPKVPGQVTGSHPGPQYPPAAELDGLYLKTDPSLPVQVSRLLVPGSQEFTLVDKEVSCDFRVKLNYHNNTNSVYIYRASAFDGVRTYDGFASGGARICSVFACTNSSIESCGRRFDEYDSNSAAIFEELSITTTVPKVNFDITVEADDSAYFPVSMEMSILPLKPEDFQYTMEERNGQAVYDVSLRKLDAELLSFGLWGRVYGRDGEEPTETDSSASYGLNSLLLTIGVALAVFP